MFSLIISLKDIQTRSQNSDMSEKHENHYRTLFTRRAIVWTHIHVPNDASQIVHFIYQRCQLPTLRKRIYKLNFDHLNLMARIWLSVSFDRLPEL